ncbi:sel1 repeat family protein [Acinetobacter sp. B5B]|uniref:tetratricopeptide repeat protein n=1 Tax=Acinetobacter baretiae TaxID=2605383 RepID=UPI0018C215AD|nr:SEL1-like repeat protein [Acinetobacter baretiae]MBF7684200.1 sel1 repeat family protein [Acinetobacter baretiae]
MEMSKVFKASLIVSLLSFTFSKSVLASNIKQTDPENCSCTNDFFQPTQTDYLNAIESTTDLNNINNQIIYAEILHKYWWNTHNKYESKALFDQAKNKGSLFAEYLAIDLNLGYHSNASRESLMALSKKGFPLAMYTLANYKLEDLKEFRGRMINQDGYDQKILDIENLYLKALDQAKTPFPEFYYALGDLNLYYKNKKDRSKNVLLAKDWYLKSSQLGYPYAYIRLGVMYHAGLGVKQSDYEAAILYRKALSMGIHDYGDASINLNIIKNTNPQVKNLLGEDEKPPSDYPLLNISSYTRYLDLSRADTKAIFGKFLLLSEDKGNGYKFLTLASHQGSIYADYELGNQLYKKSEKDQNEAIELLKRASQNGLSEASFDLYQIYRVKKDQTQADFFYKRSLNQKNQYEH